MENTLKAKKAFDDDSCIDISANELYCKNNDGLKISGIKKSATNAICMSTTDKSYCKNTNNQSVTTTDTLKARTSLTDITCVDIVANSAFCRNIEGIKIQGFKKTATNAECSNEDVSACKGANNQAVTTTNTLKARTSSTDATCVDIGATDAFCRNIEGIKIQGFKKTATNAECVNFTDKTKCKDTNNQTITLVNTLKARTSSTDATCVDIGATDAFCRNTDVIKEAGFKKTATNAECSSTDKTVCKDANNQAVTVTNTLKARTSSTDATCVDIGATDAFCRNTDGIKVAGFKKTATNAECSSTDKTVCKDTNNQAVTATNTLKARTSSTDATCVDIGATDAFCRNTDGIKVAGFKKTATNAEC
jgi:hypothetical protein